MTKDNRRKTQRISFYCVDFARMEVNKALAIFGTIVNISRGGLLIELFPMGPSTTLGIGDTIKLESCPEALDTLLTGARGTIVWIGGDQCGVRFEKPLDGDAKSLRRKLNEHDFQAWKDTAA